MLRLCNYDYYGTDSGVAHNIESLHSYNSSLVCGSLPTNLQSTACKSKYRVLQSLQQSLKTEDPRPFLIWKK